MPIVFLFTMCAAKVTNGLKILAESLVVPRRTTVNRWSVKIAQPLQFILSLKRNWRKIFWKEFLMVAVKRKFLHLEQYI